MPSFFPGILQPSKTQSRGNNDQVGEDKRRSGLTRSRSGPLLLFGNQDKMRVRTLFDAKENDPPSHVRRRQQRSPTSSILCGALMCVNSTDSATTYDVASLDLAVDYESLLASAPKQRTLSFASVSTAHASNLSSGTKTPPPSPVHDKKESLKERKIDRAEPPSFDRVEPPSFDRVEPPPSNQTEPFSSKRTFPLPPRHHQRNRTERTRPAVGRSKSMPKQFMVRVHAPAPAASPAPPLDCVRSGQSKPAPQSNRASRSELFRVKTKEQTERMRRLLTKGRLRRKPRDPSPSPSEQTMASPAMTEIRSARGRPKRKSKGQ